MTNFKKYCAFTLSELLLSLIIVGVIAVLTVPVIMNNVQNRLFVTKLKNTVAEIEQLAQQELIKHRTRDLSNTDFASDSTLLTDKHFSIVKSCSASNAKRDCWKTSATGKDKIQYKHLNKSNYTPGSGLAHKTVVLKNGVMLDFFKGLDYEQAYRGGALAGYIYVDLNGNEKPNIVGRDFFVFWITKTGKIVGHAYALGQSLTVKQLNTLCKSDRQYCYEALANNNWKMDY